MPGISQDNLKDKQTYFVPHLIHEITEMDKRFITGVLKDALCQHIRLPTSNNNEKGLMTKY